MSGGRLSDAAIARYDGRVPRYTSYPTAVQFNAGVGAAEHAAWLGQVGADEPVSVYVHLPYCKSLCLYCGCTMKVTHQPQSQRRYLDVLLREIALLRAQLAAPVKVSTLHLGGGTPTYMSPEMLGELVAALRAAFTFMPGMEFSVEIDPRTLEDVMIDALPKLGVNRVSLGVQDTDEAVQQAIRRIQPREMTARAVERLRAVGIHQINFDLVYGLPLQTPASVAATLDDVLALAPQRVAVYGYAHVPWVKPHQKVLEQYPIPDAGERLELFKLIQERFAAAGYVQVGIDHFAKPEDGLARALNSRTLRRNFMGYTTDAAEVLLGLGASSISSLPGGFVQNVADLADYMQRIEDGSLASHRGYAYAADDVAVQKLIMQLMCYAGVGAVPVAPELLDSARTNLAPMVEDGLVEVGPDYLQVSPEGQPLTRVVAACFDRYLKREGGCYSRAL